MLSMVVIAVVVYPTATGMRSILGWKPLVEIGRAVLRAVPVALAGVRDRARLPLGQLAQVRRGDAGHGRADGAVVPFRRDADPQGLPRSLAPRAAQRPRRGADPPVAPHQFHDLRRRGRARRHSSCSTCRSNTSTRPSAVPTPSSRCPPLPRPSLRPRLGHEQRAAPAATTAPASATAETPVVDRVQRRHRRLLGGDGSIRLGERGSGAHHGSGRDGTPTTAPSLPRRVVVVGDSQAHSLAINLPDGIERHVRHHRRLGRGVRRVRRGQGAVGADGFNRSFGDCQGWPAKWGRCGVVGRRRGRAGGARRVGRVRPAAGRSDARVRHVRGRRLLPRPAPAGHRRAARRRRPCRAARGAVHAPPGRQGRRRAGPAGAR